jgi:hypothetical protein
MNDWPTEGKVILAANPWRIAAVAKREGYPTDRFFESDQVPDNKVIIIDMDKALKLDYN